MENWNVVMLEVAGSLFAAILAAVFTYIGVRKTIKSNNLKANARITWIQNVRETTANLFAEYF